MRVPAALRDFSAIRCSFLDVGLAYGVHQLQEFRLNVSILLEDGADPKSMNIRIFNCC